MTSDIPQGQGREFTIENRVVAVFHSSEGFLAVDAMCAHQGGPLAKVSWTRLVLTCPWHGWQYDVATGCNLLTGKKMLDVFSVDIRGRPKSGSP